MTDLERIDSGNEEEVFDAEENEDAVAPIQYDISSYGADYDVEGLVRRLNKNEILIPPFQRNFIWNINEASKFVESLLLGLPVPGIFLMREPDTNKLLVIDGQQRLKTLQFFYQGYFNPQADDTRSRIFKLTNVQSHLEGKTYSDLGESDRILLDNSLIHATIIKQDSPDDNDTSIYYIFDRLNSTGRLLNAQEIRSAVDHGEFISLIDELNSYENWRNIFGKISPRLKDQELILRFFAFYYNFENYSVPMKNFLNSFSKAKKNSNKTFLAQAENVFKQMVDTAWESFGRDAFRPSRIVNAAVFDSVGVGLAKRLEQGKIKNIEDLKVRYQELLEDGDYKDAISAVTSSEASVKKRISKAISVFSDVE